VAYARCMQKHGEPEFPDPDSAGTFRVAAIAALDRNSPQFQGALRSCLKLRPRATSQEIAQLEAQLLKFSACMRAHGEPTFPDFQLGGGVAARQAAQYLKTIDPNSPQFQSALATCRSLLPATIGDALAP